MRLTAETANQIVNDLADRLDRGALVIYSGTRPRVVEEVFQDALARVLLASPAFELAVDGVAVARDLPESAILASGEATWAQWQNVGGEVLADLVVRAVDAEDADTADMLLDRTDFQRGGLCIVSRATLSLPRTSV